MIKRVSKCNFKLIFIIILFNGLSTIAQNTEKTTLLAFLTSLETTHNVRFSYAPNDIVDITIVTPDLTESLSEVLDYLENNTALHFEQLNDRYITIVKKTTNKLCGKILDATTNLPITGATVTLDETDFTAITDKEGRFNLPGNTQATNFVVNFFNYGTEQFSIDQLDENCPTIFMQIAILTLSEVKLQTLFTKGISKHKDGSFVINTENFGLLPGQVEGDVLQIAQALPGVESADETISNINIRGGNRDENTILWDDIRMYQSGHFFGLISAFNPDLTQNVTVYKNGTNPRYGEGVSGVIDMRSSNIITDTFSGGVGFNMINTSVFAEVPISETFGMQLSGRRSINDFLRSPIYGIYEDRIYQDTEITALQSNSSSADVTSENEFNFYDFSAKLLWDPSEETSIRLNFLTIDNALEFTETLNTPPSSETSKLDQRSIVGGLSWNQSWSSKVETIMLAYGSYYLLNSLNEDILTTQELVQENEVLQNGLKLDAKYQFSDYYSLQAGYHFSETGVGNTQDVNLPRFRSFEKRVLRTHSAFANLKSRLNKNKTHVNLGVRANYFAKFERILLEPRLSIYRSLGSGFSVEALGEFKSQTTTQRIDFESDFLGVEKRRWVLTDNLNIPIIQSKQASVGLAYNKNNWFVNLEGFYKHVEGITSSNQGFQNQFQFTRTTGDYSAKGLEFVLNKKTRSFSTWISYLLMENEYEFESLDPSQFPNNLDIRHTLSLASTYSYKSLKLALGINWHSGMPYTEPLAGNEIGTQNGVSFMQYSQPNENRLPNYFRTDLSAEYLWNLSNRFDAKFNFSILNLFNSENVINRRYAIDDDENGDPRINQIDEISLGITPNFAFQLLF